MAQIVVACQSVTSLDTNITHPSSYLWLHSIRKPLSLNFARIYRFDISTFATYTLSLFNHTHHRSEYLWFKLKFWVGVCSGFTFLVKDWFSKEQLQFWWVWVNVFPHCVKWAHSFWLPRKRPAIVNQFLCLRYHIEMLFELHLIAIGVITFPLLDAESWAATTI